MHRYLTLLLFIGLAFLGCSSHLSVNVIDADTGLSINTVSVEVTQEGNLVTHKANTVGGVVSFKKIKRGPVNIFIPESKDYFSKTINLEFGPALLNPVFSSRRWGVLLPLRNASI